MLAATADLNAQDYEARYRNGYGTMYPESHIVRVHKRVLEWQLGLTTGQVFDFGCGVGANLKYFRDCGFAVHGCDTSASAISECRKLMPESSASFHVTAVQPKLLELAPEESIDVFLSNQVLYYLDDASIKDVVSQAHQLARPGGVFVATMMSHTHCFYRFAQGQEGDFTRIELDTPRQQASSLINFKDKDQLEPLFTPFRKLHIGSYGCEILEEEGSSHHWLFIGVRD